ncbi:hypothetical protein GCM10027568_31100 [Humibacter soli]
MDDRHPTYPARTGAAGVWIWTAVIIAVIAAAGFVITVATAGGYAG